MPSKFVPKPAIEKLPLAVRKDVRDKYENKKAEWEEELNQTLGVPITINFNANAVWAYYVGESTNAGYYLAGYVDGFIDASKRFVDTFGDIGKEYFKNAVHKNEVILEVNGSDDASYIDADIVEGAFRILFKPDSFGANQGFLYDPFVKAINDAPHDSTPLSLHAKISIEKSYTPEIDELRTEIANILNMPDLILEPNFDKVHAALSVRTDSWQRNLGKAALEYFRDGIKYQLERQKFKDDDMLQEGFAEAVTSKTIAIRIVDKTEMSYNEVVIEDGVVYLQMTPEYWWGNVSDAGRNLVDLL